MGRKRNVLVREFFDFQCETKINTCKVCNAKLTGENITNLRRHIVAAHYELYKREMEQLESDDKAEEKKIQFSVKMSKREVADSCLAFITKHAQPFSFFNTEAFKTLTQQVFKGLNMAPLTSSNICELLNKRRDELIAHVKKVTKGRMIAIKMDSATRHYRSMLGINIQLIVNGRLQIFTLAMKEFKEAQTAVNLKAELERVLVAFEISEGQVYSITTDNGRNMLKAVDLMAASSELNDDNSSLGDDEDLAISLEAGVKSIRCAAHTLQLAVKDFLLEADDGIVDRAREVVKTLRTPRLRRTLEMFNLSIPPTYVVTRWSSTFVMLEALLRYKDVCTEYLQEPLKIDDWKKIEELVSVLRPVYNTTLTLQGEQLLLGDFYRAWFTLKVMIKAESSAMANMLHRCVEKREAQLKSEMLNAALFLDPRFRRILTADQKQKAQRHLKRLVNKLIALEEHCNASNVPTSSPTMPSQNLLIDESSSQSTSSLLNATLRELEADSSSDVEEDTEVCRRKLAAYSEIDTYKAPRVSIDMDLMQYWEDMKFTIPYLRLLAHTVHAVPATQVSVERAFSALRLVLDDHRCNLSEDHLEAIMFVKLNE